MLLVNDVIDFVGMIANKGKKYPSIGVISDVRNSQSDVNLTLSTA